MITSLIPDGLVGGMLIGLSAGTLLLGNGKILGAAGIVRSVFQQPLKTTLFLAPSSSSSSSWKVHFLAAFALVSDLYRRYTESVLAASTTSAASGSSSGTGSSGDAEFVVSATGYAVAGFLVGLGTTMGNGCTSGHGICGLARFSKRSLAAVVAFMATGMLTATICDPGGCPMAPWLRETVGSSESLSSRESSSGTDLYMYYKVLLLLLSKWIGTMVTGVLVAASGYGALCRPGAAEDGDTNKKDDDDDESAAPQQQQLRSTIVSWISGGLFALGLAVSGMVESKRIAGFLDAKGMANGTWDPTLVFVMGGGLLVSALSYQFVPGYDLLLKNSPTLQRPWSSCTYSVPTNTTIDAKLLVGAAIFGIGWGIGRICPGPGVFHAATGHPSVLYIWWPCFWLGSLVPSYL